VRQSVSLQGDLLGTLMLSCTLTGPRHGLWGSNGSWHGVALLWCHRGPVWIGLDGGWCGVDIETQQPAAQVTLDDEMLVRLGVSVMRSC